MNYKNQFKKSCYIFYLIFFVTILLPNTASAAVYYVSTTGEDTNTGTQSAPFGTIKYGIGVLQSGDTLFIRGGTYPEQLLSNSGTNFPAGTSWSNPVTIAAYSDGTNTETVILKPNSEGGGGAIGIGSSSIKYLIIDGIVIDAVNRPTAINISGGANHIRFQNVEVKNATQFGVHLSTNNDDTANDMFNEFINMNVHHIGTRKNLDHGFYISTSGNLFEQCDIHHNAAWGIHQYTLSGKPRINNNIIRNNRIHHNGIELLSGGGIILGNGDNNRIYNNVVWENLNGIQISPYMSPTNTGVYHNTVYANQGSGILISSGSMDTEVLNNIIYQNELYDQANETVINNNLTTNPSFVDESGGDFHLQSNSTSIDTGMTLNEVTKDFDGIERPQGSFPDIGAFEYLQQTPDDGNPSPPQNLQFKN